VRVDNGMVGGHSGFHSRLSRTYHLSISHAPVYFPLISALAWFTTTALVVLLLLVPCAHGRLSDPSDSSVEDGSRDARNNRQLLFFQWEEDNSCRGESNCENAFGVPGNTMNGFRGGQCIERCIFSDVRQIWFQVFWGWQCGPCA
jgi:hypothetical protein